MSNMCWSTGFNDVEMLVLCQWFLMLYVYIYISIYRSIYLSSHMGMGHSRTHSRGPNGGWLIKTGQYSYSCSSSSYIFEYQHLLLQYLADLHWLVSVSYLIYTTQSHQSLTQSNAHRMSFGINPANHLQAPLAQGAHAPGPWCWAAGPRWPESSLMAS
jgi:hypothetical protein